MRWRLWRERAREEKNRQHNFIELEITNQVRDGLRRFFISHCSTHYRLNWSLCYLLLNHCQFLSLHSSLTAAMTSDERRRKKNLQRFYFTHFKERERMLNDFLWSSQRRRITWENKWAENSVFFFWKGQSWYNFDMRCDVVDRFVRRLKKK